MAPAFTVILGGQFDTCGLIVSTVITFKVHVFTFPSPSWMVNVSRVEVALVIIVPIGGTWEVATLEQFSKKPTMGTKFCNVCWHIEFK